MALELGFANAPTSRCRLPEQPGSWCWVERSHGRWRSRGDLLYVPVCDTSIPYVPCPGYPYSRSFCRCHRVRPRDVRTANGQDGPVTPLPPFQTRPSGIEGIRLDPEIVWKAGMTSSGASNRLGTAEELFLLGCRPESIEWGKKRCWKGFPLGR